MADWLSPEVRSYIMSQIRSQDTKPELIVRRFLHNSGFRYRKNVKGLPGKPDIVLRKYQTAILVHGCFWHGHDSCKGYKPPKSNVEYWESKIKRNRENDKKHLTNLTEMGFNVITIWECELKRKKLEETLTSVKNRILETGKIANG